MIQLKILLFLLPVTTLGLKFTQNSDFVAYLTKNGKSYTDATEFQMRQKLYLETDVFIKERNA